MFKTLRIGVGVLAVVLALLCVNGNAQATAVWHTISFTGTEMFNYTTTVAARADQDAPRRLRDWGPGPNYPLNQQLQSDGDMDSDGINDFAEWASGSLSSYGFSYFNLSGYTSPPGGWGQKYQAVADNGSNNFGADSWRNQTVNGVAVTSGMGTSNTWWDGGIVLANQSYNTDDYAFPVWRAPVGTTLTMANAANWRFSVDVLMENHDTAFETDGSLRVWFGGLNVRQDEEVAALDVAGIMKVSEVPEPSSLLLIGGLLAGLGLMRLRKRS